MARVTDLETITGFFEGVLYWAYVIGCLHAVR